MQGLIEDVIQALGWATLKVVTLGAYKRPADGERLLEGLVGFMVVVAASWVLLWMHSSGA